MNKAAVLAFLLMSSGCITVKCEKEPQKEEKGRIVPPQRDDGKIHTISQKEVLP